LKAIADPEWSDTPGGILAFGECPQIVGETGDKTISVRVNVADDTTACVLFECAAMTLRTVPVSGGGYRVAVDIYKVGSTITLPTTTVLDEGTTYTVGATHDLSTGDIKIFVDDVEDNSVGGTDNVPTINALPIWRVGAPPESWITDCAVWSSDVLTPVPWEVFSLGGNSITSGSSTATITLTGLTIPDGAVVLVFSHCGLNSASATTCAATGITFAEVVRFDDTAVNPDRLCTIFRGVASGAGSTITVTFPGNTGEKSVGACYIINAPTTNNGADVIAGTSGSDFTQPWSLTLSPTAGHAVLGFAFVFDGAGTGITGTSGTQVLDHSPGSNYSVGIVKWPTGQTNPQMACAGTNNGAAIAVELTGLLT
jgi:hypothetical protein